MTEVPTNLAWQCEVCGSEGLGLEALIGHLESDHPEHGTVERWPDGGLVIHEPDMVAQDVR